MKIAVEGQGTNTSQTYNQLPGMPSRQTVLLDMVEAEKLYDELHKLFGHKNKPVYHELKSKAEPVKDTTPLPKIDLPPLKKDVAPGTERQQTIADYIRDMEKQKPYKPFENWPNPYAPTFPYYCPPPSPSDPSLYRTTCSFNPDGPQNSVPPYGSFGPERL